MLKRNAVALRSAGHVRKSGATSGRVLQRYEPEFERDIVIQPHQTF